MKQKRSLCTTIPSHHQFRDVALKLTAAKERMGKEDGGLARHSVECTRGIDWENARIVGVENRLRQRKVREGIESLRTIHNRKKVLNSFESFIGDLYWTSILIEIM